MSSLRFVELDDHIYRDIPDDWTIDTIRQKSLRTVENLPLILRIEYTLKL